MNRRISRGLLSALLYCGFIAMPFAETQENRLPNVQIQDAIQRVFASERFQSTKGNITEVIARQRLGHELLIGQRGVERSSIHDRRRFWTIDLHVESDSGQPRYWFRAIVDVENGEIID